MELIKSVQVESINGEKQQDVIVELANGRDDDQLFSPTVFDDVAFGPLHMNLPADEVHVRFERALAAVGMAAFAHRVPHRMSLGQRKRVALATEIRYLVLHGVIHALGYDHETDGGEMNALELKLRRSVGLL